MKVELKQMASLLSILVIIAGAIVAINAYFAKQTGVDKLAKRVDIGIVSDDIRYTEQRIMRFKVERRETPLTPEEEDLLEEERKRLRDLEEERKQKREMYEQSR